MVRGQRGKGQELPQAQGLLTVTVRVQRQWGSGGDFSGLGVVQRCFTDRQGAQQREAELETSRATWRWRRREGGTAEGEASGGRIWEGVLDNRGHARREGELNCIIFNCRN